MLLEQMSGNVPIREISHTADRAFQVRGYDLASLFTHAAQAVCGVEEGRLKRVLNVSRYVELSAVDLESLLVNWLNELLYLEEMHGEAYSRFEVVLHPGNHLGAWVHGTVAPGKRRTIKAVTFHDLKLKRAGGAWEATIVVDV